jgi:hypothetical protein
MKMKMVVLKSSPPMLSEAEEERLEHALAERSAEIFAQTGLYIPCAVLDVTAR